MLYDNADVTAEGRLFLEYILREPRPSKTPSKAIQVPPRITMGLR